MTNAAADSRFSNLDLDDEAPAAVAAPVAAAAAAAEAPRCGRCGFRLPDLNAEGLCSSCVRLAQPREVTTTLTSAGVPMSPRMARFWGLVTPRTGLHSFSPAESIHGHLPALRALRAEQQARYDAMDASPERAHQGILLQDLDGLMRRADNRVSGNRGVAQAHAAPQAATLEQIAAESAAVAAPVAAAPVADTAVAAAPKTLQQDLIAVENSDLSSGTMTYWSLPGTVDGAKLAAAWTAEGLDGVLVPPSAPSVTVALHRACKAQASARRLLRSHPEGGWVFVEESTVEESGAKTLDYALGVRVRLDYPLTATGEQDTTAEPRLVITPPGGKDATPEARAAARQIGESIATKFDEVRSQIASVDVSGWLVDTVQGSLGGVALRATGGFYFVPKAQTETLAKIVRALAAASAHVVYEIPVLRGSKSVAAVLDAIRAEVDGVITTITAAIEDEKFGPRAARARADEILALTDKVRSYERLLGVQLGETVARLDTLRHRLATMTTRAGNLEID